MTGLKDGWIARQTFVCAGSNWGFFCGHARQHFVWNGSNWGFFKQTQISSWAGSQRSVNPYLNAWHSGLKYPKIILNGNCIICFKQVLNFLIVCLEIEKNSKHVDINLSY